MDLRLLLCGVFFDPPQPRRAQAEAPLVFFSPTQPTLECSDIREKIRERPSELFVLMRGLSDSQILYGLIYIIYSLEVFPYTV